MDKEILDNLLAYCNKSKEEEKNRKFITCKSENISGNKGGLNKNEKELTKEELFKMKGEILINKIKKQKSYDILDLSGPKILDFEEIYKNMNIEQISANLKQEKVQDIQNFVEKEVEEEEKKKF
jgi:hypothetical protein